jgi:serine-type D-Ala-D-Ala carboxypeptidase/endopeptidase (penicillin-binding protein 4)
LTLVQCTVQPDNPLMPLKLSCLSLLGASAVLACMGSAVQAAAPSGSSLPVAVAKALAQAQVPHDAVSLLVVDTSGRAPPRLSHRPDAPLNPASVMKLVTTYAALDVLGPGFVWKTGVVLDGTLSDGLLRGNLVLRGGGDPKLVVERLQAMLLDVQVRAGARVIHGDIVLDRSAFQAPQASAADFDGEALRPYNAQPDALLINFKTVVMTFTPDPAQARVLVRSEPPLAGLVIDETVPLSRGPCGDWRGDLRASVQDANRWQFSGSYALACGERTWPSAYIDPGAFAGRAVEGSWRLLGGLLTGRVRDATAGEAASLARTGTLSGKQPLVQFDSPSLPLLDVVYDVNKFSNNVMAQHLFLTLGLHAPMGQAQTGTLVAAREATQAWWRKTLPGTVPPVLDNGSGLSRSERVSAAALAAMLQHAGSSPVGQSLIATLPIAGTDATMRSRARSVAGQAFVKTGSLRDVTAIAGYANGVSGARYVVVGMVNHPNASAARPALDALLQWAVQDRPGPAAALGPETNARLSEAVR